MTDQLFFLSPDIVHIITEYFFPLFFLSAWILVLVRIQRLPEKHQMEFQLLDKRLGLITSGSMGMGEKLMHLESQLQSIVDTQQRGIESESQFSYTRASKLIEEGVDPSLITSNCGLSDSEVALMQLLHSTREKQLDSGVTSA